MSEFMDILKNVGESRFVKEIGAELARLGVQGQAEAANALFNGQAYVPYGVGQRGTYQGTPEAPETPTVDLPQQSHGRSM